MQRWFMDVIKRRTFSKKDSSGITTNTTGESTVAIQNQPRSPGEKSLSILIQHLLGLTGKLTFLKGLGSTSMTTKLAK